MSPGGISTKILVPMNSTLAFTVALLKMRMDLGGLLLLLLLLLLRERLLLFIVALL